MQIFESNSSLGYDELAYFINIKDNIYLCIGLSRGVKESFFGATFQIGETTQLDDHEINPSDYNIEDSPIYDTFLFKEFLKHL